MLSFVFFSLLLVPHVFLQTEYAKQMLGKWKPQIVAGNILSASGVNSYTKARIALEDSRCLGALVRIFDKQYTFCIFIINMQQNATIVTASIYGSPVIYAAARRELSEWHEATFPDVVLSFLEDC
jgi:hypothetical protein